MKILIALDASTQSERALDFVTHMRWPKGSEAIVLSVAQPTAAVLAGAYEQPAFPAAPLEEERRRLEELVAGAERTLREAGLSTEGRVVAGDARETLVQAAQSEGVDLIVMGSHGHTGVAKLVLGSVSSHVMTHAPCSVLVVKADSR